jgi:hypothetical protein
MDANLLKTKFEKLGARAKIRPLARSRWQPEPGGVVIDIRHETNRAGLRDTKEKFLCGHDERHWFVAGVSEQRSG